MTVRDLILVGYTTRLRDDHLLWVPEFQPNKNVTKPETAARQVEEKAQQFLEQSGDIPFFGQLANVSLYSAKQEEVVRLTSELDDNLLGSRVAEIVHSWHPDLFDDVSDNGEGANDIADNGTDETGYGPSMLPFHSNRVYFVGFEISKFVRLAALEAVEARKRTLPIFMWSSGSYRELSHLLQPDRVSRALPLRLPLQRLGIPDFIDGTPGRDAEADLQIAIEVALALDLAPHLMRGVTLPQIKPSARLSRKIAG